MVVKDGCKAAKRTAATRGFDGFAAEERAAMKDHANGLKETARRGARATRADGESDVLAKIDETQEPDRHPAERIHAIVKTSAPELTPRTWYGMPAYAKDGNVICFFQSAQKFKSRYTTLGFGDKAKLDDGDLWPTYLALQELTPAVEAQIAGLLTKAGG